MAKNITRIEPFDMGKVISEPAEHKGLFISLENLNKNNEFVVAACDNSTGDAFVEEFDSVKEAVLWLERYRAERNDNNGRPILAHELADKWIQSELCKKSRGDFIALARSAVPDDGVKPIFKRRVEPVFCVYMDGSTGAEERGFADWCCGKCGEPVGEQYILTKHDQKKCNFCPRCGTKVDWKAAKKENEQ